MTENDSGRAGKANALINETSPYLLQHAHNPVDWHPWGEEAFVLAKRVEKPIFLSIGYSACHWCHVMERESFEDPSVAALLNENFVSIKVDREERPDLDEVYMTAVQLLTGAGGWPMSVFLTPDLKPFFAGTYFPPVDVPGRPAFKNVLKSIATSWRAGRTDIMNSASKVTEAVKDHLAYTDGAGGHVTDEMLEHAVDVLKSSVDRVNGGFGTAPKFPPCGAIDFLMRLYARTHDKSLLGMVTATLTRMARGGIYDQLGGGFHRYSVDAQWLVPHFEKMLYDNALLARVYLEAFQATQNPLFRRIAVETLDYLLRDMSDSGGGFHSSEDADSEGREGSFYLWSRKEILDALGAEDGSIFCTFYSVREEGNFPSHERYHAGQNILHVAHPPEDIAHAFHVKPEELGAKMRELRAKLLAVRNRRIRPGCDDKVLTSWNALAVSAFALGFQVTEDTRYRQAAARIGDFLMENMAVDGELLHTYRKGERRIAGMLDDYAFTVLAFIDLYETTFDLRWVSLADVFGRKMITLFWDDNGKQFFHAARSQTHLIARSHPALDGAEPSGNSAAAFAYLRMARFVDDWGYEKRARDVIESNTAAMKKSPQAFTKMFCAADMLLHPPSEVAIVGNRGAADTMALFRALHAHFVPSKIVAFLDPLSPDAADAEARIPLLKAKKMVSDKAAAYVCKNFTCGSPARTPEELLHALGI